MTRAIHEDEAIAAAGGGELPEVVLPTTCPSRFTGQPCVLAPGHKKGHRSESGRAWTGSQADAVPGPTRAGDGLYSDETEEEDELRARTRELAETAPASAKTRARRGRSLPLAEAADVARSLTPELPAEYNPALPVASIRASKNNPRRRKPDTSELEASIREHGVIVPIELRYRPDPDTNTDYEITYGECRWTASVRVGRPTIPAKIVECSDDVAFERRVLENLQRKDVHPIDEAEGFQAMRDSGRDVDYIAQKTGKSVSWIYARLKLCDLAPEVRDQVDDAGLAPSVALLIARIPDARYQKWAARECMRVDEMRLPEDDDDGTDEYQDHIRRLEVLNEQAYSAMDTHVARQARGPEDDDGGRRPMTVREAQLHLQRFYMTRLELAKFDLADERLLPDVGSCNKCTLRTGNQRELFTDVKRADVCTNPPCFDRKTRAAFEAAAAPAIAAGAKLLEAAEARRVFTSPFAPDLIGGSAPYVEPDAPVPWELLAPAQQSKRPTWESLLGKKGLADVGKVVAQDGTGAARELITKADAVKMLRDAGKLPTAAGKTGTQGKGGGNDWAASEEKRKAKREMHERVLLAIVKGIGPKVMAAKPVVVWRVIAGFVGNLVQNGDGYEAVCALAGVDAKRGGKPAAEAADRLVAKAKDASELVTLAVQFTLLEMAQMPYSGKGLDADAAAAFKALGIDWDKAHAAEVAAAKAAEKEAKKALPKGKGKPAKKGATKR